MDIKEFREAFIAYRQSADQEAEQFKDSSLALTKLRKLYEGFDGSELGMANQVLTEWVLSDDENLRFDALDLVSFFKITDVFSALKELTGRLESSAKPGAPFELKKVNRIISELS